MADYRRSLDVLREEWKDCTKCSLGEHRDQVGGEFVFGEGYTRGIMFIGLGPEKDEETSGRPFVSDNGEILRRAIAKLNLQNCYLTNLVSCRSCEQAQYASGEPVWMKNRQSGRSEPFIVNRPPTDDQIEACSPRLMEQIYMVDPIIVVALGPEAAKALPAKQKFRAMRDERGKTRPIHIPGHWRLPVLTEKKRVWRRKVHGEIVMPTKQNQVEYLLFPTWHPEHVARNSRDLRQGNVVDQFLTDLKEVARIYDRYMREAHGVVPSERTVTAEDILPEN